MVDHLHDPDGFCRGTLGVVNGRVIFRSQNTSENWDIPLDAVVSAAPLPDVGKLTLRISTSPPGQSRSRTQETREPPNLEISYRAATGMSILVRQRGSNATITFYRPDSSILGNGSVTWNSGRGRFVGTIEINYVCGSLDTRTIVIPGRLELFGENGLTLRTRLQMASDLNCDQNRWNLTWYEDKWYLD